MIRDHVREMKRVVDLHHQTQNAVYEEKFQCHSEAWEQFQRLQLFHENVVKELANERAALASRAATMEAANSVCEQEREAQLKAVSAIAERRLEEKYTETLVKLREE